MGHLSGGPTSLYHIPGSAVLGDGDGCDRLVKRTMRKVCVHSKKVSGMVMYNVASPLMVMQFGAGEWMVLYNPGFDHKFTEREMTAMMVHELAHVQLGHLEERAALPDMRGLSKTSRRNQWRCAAARRPTPTRGPPRRGTDWTLRRHWRR